MFLTYLKPFVEFILKLYLVIILCHCDNYAMRQVFNTYWLYSFYRDRQRTIANWVIQYLSIKSENPSEIAVNETVSGKVRVLYPERDKLLAKCCHLQIYSKYFFTVFICLSNVNV